MRAEKELLEIEKMSIVSSPVWSIYKGLLERLSRKLRSTSWEKLRVTRNEEKDGE